MPDEIDFVLPISRPQIHSQDERTVINIAINCQQLYTEIRAGCLLGINFVPSSHIRYDNSYAWWRGNGPAILGKLATGYIKRVISRLPCLQSHTSAPFWAAA